jgi:hypothetical protein
MGELGHRDGFKVLQSCSRALSMQCWDANLDFAHPSGRVDVELAAQ